MSSPSPPPNNILSDPVAELVSALHMNAFGLDPTTTSVVLEESFPITPEDRERVGVEAIRSGQIGEGVTAKAKVGLMGEEGQLVVVLDRRGYTVSFATRFGADKGPAERRAGVVLVGPG
jgi:hypothetical protein